MFCDALLAGSTTASTRAMGTHYLFCSLQFVDFKFSSAKRACGECIARIVQVRRFLQAIDPPEPAVRVQVARVGRLRCGQSAPEPVPRLPPPQVPRRRHESRRCAPAPLSSNRTGPLLHSRSPSRKNYILRKVEIHSEK